MAIAADPYRRPRGQLPASVFQPFIKLHRASAHVFATGLGWSVFMLGATYGHIHQTMQEGNFAPYNFLTIFSDGFIAVWLLVLLYLYYRLGGFEKQDQTAGHERQTG